MPQSLLCDRDQHCRVIGADRSGVDRYLGMVEAAGSIPARSILFCERTVIDGLIARITSIMTVSMNQLMFPTRFFR